MMPDFDLRVCWGQGCRGQTVVGVKVGNLPKTQVKTKKTGVINSDITPVLNLGKSANWGQIGVNLK